MSDPFSDYDRIKSESKPLKKEIGGQEFEFPGACPAPVAMDFLGTVIATEGQIDLELLAMRSLGEILGEEEMTRLGSVTSFPELRALCTGLFQHYGLLSNPKDIAPNRKARRASGSKKKSSRGSARSEQTSVTTTN